MIRTRLQGDAPFFPNMLNNGKVEVCLKEDVDKVIAEKDAEIKELQAIRKRLEEANEKVEGLNDTLYNEWKFLFKKWCGVEKEADK